MEIGRGFRDSIDHEINPTNMSESELSAAYIPRECQKYLDPSEKEKWRKERAPAAAAAGNPYGDAGSHPR